MTGLGSVSATGAGHPTVFVFCPASGLCLGHDYDRIMTGMEQVSTHVNRCKMNQAKQKQAMCLRCVWVML